MKICISVIIPTYRPQEYFWECLNSLRNQTYDKNRFEIIIVLNGCNEPYHFKIQSYINRELKSYNVRFIQTNTPGVSNARNVGLNASRGDYISFIDDDDYVSSTYLQSLYDNIRVDSMPVSNILAFNDSEKRIIPYYISALFQKIKGYEKIGIMKSRSYMSIPYAKLIRASDISNRKFNTSFKIGEDGLFMLSISDKIKYVSPTDELAIYYRRYRKGSAITEKKSIGEILKNKIKLAFAYFPYLVQPWKYNFIFCLTRYAALLR